MGISRFPMATLGVAWLAGCLLPAAWAQQSPSPVEAKVAWATRLDGDIPRLDGCLDEADWARATWIRGLTQKDPVEGLMRALIILFSKFLEWVHLPFNQPQPFLYRVLRHP